MNNELSRISRLVDDDGTTHLADYTYLGRNRTAQVDFAQPGVKFTWLWQTGDSQNPPADPYTGWDRFGRAVDLRWIDSNDAELERLKHGYDEASNRLYRKNPVATGYSAQEDQLYGYDGLYQLEQFQRGTLNGGNDGMTGTIAAQENFAFDPTGNWNEFVVRANESPVLEQERQHNQANGLTEIDSSAAHVAEDAAGNMTKVPRPGDWGEKYDLTYDAWNRLVKVADGETTVAEYAYDGLHRRTKKVTGSDTRHYYYSDQWQILEERVNTSEDPDRQFVWGLRYIDDLILRDRELGEEDERLYVIQDYFQPTAVISSTDGEVLERYGYDAFGTSRVLDDEFEPKGDSEYEWETRYGAYRWDGETGLYQVRHRYLHTGLGRWVTRDPIGRRGGLNLYRYSENNSINQIDPLGLSSVNRPPQSVYSDGSVTYGHPLPEPRPAPVHRPAASFGIGFTEDITVAAPAGAHQEIFYGVGYFSGTTDIGDFFSHGESAGPLGIYSPQNPNKDFCFNPALGLYAGVAPAVWFSNASTPEQIQLTETTTSLNFGLLGADFGISISTGGGIVVIAISGFGAGVGISATSQRTETTPSILIRPR